MAIKEVFAICFGYGVGIWFTMSALKKRALLARARRWLSTRGRILEAALYQTPNRKYTHIRIRYEFYVGGKVEGSTPRLSGGWWWNYKQQVRFVSRYAPGQDVEVFYDPRNPKQNCLDRTDKSGIIIMWILAAGGSLLSSFIVWLQFSQ